MTVRTEEKMVRDHTRGCRVLFSLFSFFFIHVVLFTFSCDAELYDRVVAFVDDQAITLSELQDEYERTREFSRSVSRSDVLNTLINRKLLARAAKQFRIEADSEDAIINEYIDLKVRAFIRVGEPEVEEFYTQNIQQFQGKQYEEIREEIETYLTEKELNVRLKEVLEELRKNAYIKIQLGPED